MTISKDAIEHLEKTVLLNDVNEELSKIKTKSSIVALPDAITLSNLEKYMPTRDSYRMSFKTKSIEDFAAYAEEFDREGAKCFIDSDCMSARIIFDLGTEDSPLHQEHTAKLELDRTSAFECLLKMNGNAFYQKDASNFIEDWSDFIEVCTSDGGAMTVAQAANAINKMTIESARNLTSEVEDFGETMSAMEKIEVKGKAKMPAIIYFTCVPYGGLDARQFQVRLSVLTGGHKPEISFRIVKLEQHEEEIVEEFKEILVGKFEEFDLKTFIGSC